MRKVSKKRQELMRQVKPIRDRLRAEIWKCEICDCSRGVLDVHEIKRGPFRAILLGERCGLLLVCRICHEELGSAKAWPEARQLAVLAERRLYDFNLKAYLALTSPRAPNRITLDEVLEHMSKDVLKVDEVAVRLRVNRRTAQSWIDSKELPAVDARPTGAARAMWRIEPGDLLRFAQARKSASEKEVQS